MIEITLEEAARLRQWFDVARQFDDSFMEDADFALVNKLSQELQLPLPQEQEQ